MFQAPSVPTGPSLPRVPRFFRGTRIGFRASPQSRQSRPSAYSLHRGQRQSHVDTYPRTRSLRSVLLVVGWILAAVAASYVLITHRAHALEWLPFALLLACPLMHIFMLGDTDIMTRDAAILPMADACAAIGHRGHCWQQGVEDLAISGDGAPTSTCTLSLRICNALSGSSA